MTTDQQPPQSDKTLTERLDVHFALQAAGLGVWEFDPITDLINWDERCRELFGLAKDNAMTYEQAIRYIHPDDADRVDLTVQWAMNPQSDGHYDVTYRTIGADDGRLRWVRFTGRATFDGLGKVARFGGIAQEVTQYVRDQEARALEVHFQEIVEQTPAATLVLRGDDFVIDQANAPMLKLIGDDTNVIGKPLLVVFPELEGEFVWQQAQKVYREGISFDSTETLVTHSSGGVIGRHWYNLAYRPLKKDGLITGVIQVVTDVTEQVVARQKAQESEVRFRTLIEEAPVATCLFVGRELVIDVANDLVLEYMGKGRSIVGKTYREVMPELENQGFFDIMDNVFTTGVLYQAKAARVDLPWDGVLSTRYFDYTYTPLRNTTGDVYAIMLMAVDVTEETIGRKKLEASEEFSNSLFHNSPVANLALTGEDMVIQSINESMLTMLGRDSSIIGMPFMVAMPELIATPLMDRLRHVLNTGETYYQPEERIELIRFGQSYTGYYNYIYSALRHTDGKPNGVVVTAIEVTAQVLARQKVEESETELAFAIDATELGVWDLNPLTNSFKGNARLKEWFGLPPEAEIDLNQAINVMAERDQQRVTASIWQALQYDLGGRYDIEYTIINPVTGRERMVRAKGKAQFGEDRIAHRFNGTLQDITERKLAEQTLKESEERFQAAVRAVNGILWTNNALGQMEGTQPGWSSLTGQTREEYQGFGWARAVHPDDAQPSIDAWSRAVAKRQTFVFEHRVRQRDGEWGLFSVRAIPLLDANGRVREWVGVHTNITEQHRAAQALAESEARYRTLSAELDQQVQIRTQQLQASVLDLERSNINLQQFAYIASHDLQEPLRKIQSFGDLLKEQYGDQLGEGINHLQRMQMAASRMSTLIRDLLSYSRISTQQENKEPVSLTAVVSAVLADLDLLIEETGAVVTVDPLPTVAGDATQLEQLVQNLLNNALKFRRVDVQPQIQVNYQVVKATALPPNLRPTRMAAAYHRIDIVDNGIGFDDKYNDRIFQVFQRLNGRSQYSGTGIGLAICEKVAANHGGAITAISQLGQGATFSVYLPQ